jgi:methionyl-tRNA formyltransferase
MLLCQHARYRERLELEQQAKEVYNSSRTCGDFHQFYSCSSSQRANYRRVLRDARGRKRLANGDAKTEEVGEALVVRGQRDTVETRLPMQL